jgi:ATP-dependent Clp protease ATP-binding subunit ClpA
VSFLCRPLTFANPRMLVVHRTGAGKTATIVQIANAYFDDRRPKARSDRTQTLHHL